MIVNSTLNTNSTGQQYAVDWNQVLNDLTTTSINNEMNTYGLKIDEETIKEGVKKALNNLLDEDTTIDLIKRYLYKFIEDNIDNPEKLVKEFFEDKNEEVSNYKKELEECKTEIEELKRKISVLEQQVYGSLNIGYYPTVLKSPCYPTSIPYYTFDYDYNTQTANNTIKSDCYAQDSSSSTTITTT